MLTETPITLSFNPIGRQRLQTSHLVTTTLNASSAQLRGRQTWCLRHLWQATIDEWRGCVGFPSAADMPGAAKLHMPGLGAVMNAAGEEPVSIVGFAKNVTVLHTSAAC